MKKIKLLIILSLFILLFSCASNKVKDYYGYYNNIYNPEFSIEFTKNSIITYQNGIMIYVIKDYIITNTTKNTMEIIFIDKNYYPVNTMIFVKYEDKILIEAVSGQYTAFYMKEGEFKILEK